MEDIKFENNKMKSIIKYWENNCKYVGGEYWIEYNDKIAISSECEELINFLKIEWED